MKGIGRSCESVLPLSGQAFALGIAHKTRGGDICESERARENDDKWGGG